MDNFQHLDVAKQDGVTVARIRERRIINDTQILELGQELAELIQAEHAAKLVINFAEVNFLSSAALGKLILVHKQARQHGGRILLTNIQPDIYELFAATRLNELFEIYKDEAEAVAAR